MESEPINARDVVGNEEGDYFADMNGRNHISASTLGLVKQIPNWCRGMNSAGESSYQWTLENFLQDSGTPSGPLVHCQHKISSSHMYWRNQISQEAGETISLLMNLDLTDFWN